MQQAQEFREESEALYLQLAGLGDEIFARPTGFKGWTVDNILRHLHLWNWAADQSLLDHPEFNTYLEAAWPHILKNDLRAFEAHWLDGLAGRQLLEAWYRTFQATADRFAQADPSGRVRWAGPGMSARSSITARLMETWGHGQAIYDLLGVKRQNTDRIRNIVVLGVNTFDWSFKNRGQQPPGTMPRLRLRAPSGVIWTYGEDNQAERIEGLAEEFCQVVTQTRNVRDTGLVVIGQTGTAWMTHAQCFAGPPENPPAPGERAIQRG